MPPRYLRRASPTRLKPCQERMIETCDAVPADQCCGVIPCTLCLEWETYADGISYGSAVFSDSSWTGTVGGASFTAYWERNAYDVCEFVVLLDGDEVYRADCDNGASCRNPAGEAEAIVNYESGTVRWSVYEPRPLPTVEDPDTGCRTHFCGDCHCSCRVLCVVITEPDGITIHRGEIPDISYSDCEAPEWSGTVGPHAITLTLDRDQETGGCIIGGSVGGQAADWLLVSGCQDLSASFTLADYTVITVACKECSCDEEQCEVCDCEFSEPLACVKGDLTSTGDPCAGGVVSGSAASVPSGKEAWVVGEDTAIPWLFNGFNITIPCGLMPLNLVCVLVRRAQNPSGPSPHIDNDIVNPCEYYFVVYDVDYNVTFIGYEYELCCGRAVAIPTCQTRLSWIRFLNVSAGRGVYSFLWWSHSGTVFYPDGFQGNGVLEGECPFSDGPNPCL